MRDIVFILLLSKFTVIESSATEFDSCVEFHICSISVFFLYFFKIRISHRHISAKAPTWVRLPLKLKNEV